MPLRHRSLNQLRSRHWFGPNGQTLFLGSAVLGALALVVYFVIAQQHTNGQSRRRFTRNTLTLDQIPFDGQAAYRWIEKLCQMGPRVSGTGGMKKQREVLIEHFQGLGGKVELQEFAVRHPVSGGRVPMANLIVRWHPDRTGRILFCAHYDTRPYPDRDPNPAERKGIFLGANDGASGVAVLAELGRHMSKFHSKLGVDFVLFDGEELVYTDRDRYFLGSEYFARQYEADQERQCEYRAGVLLDMVGDQYLELYQERNGLRWRDSRWIVETIWEKARDLGVTEFINRPYSTDLRDDHIMLHDYGGIPACDIIDFSYRSRDRRRNYWHTRADTPDKCSALSLAKVGWVIHEWLKDEGKKTK